MLRSKIFEISPSYHFKGSELYLKRLTFLVDPNRVGISTLVQGDTSFTPEKVWG